MTCANCGRKPAAEGGLCSSCRADWEASSGPLSRIRAWLTRAPYCLDCGGTGAVPAGGWELEQDNGYAPCPSCNVNHYGK